MKDYEKREITKLPERYKPITAWGYLGYTVLFAVPVIGWAFLIVFALSNANIHRRNFARSYFCIFILGIALFLALFLVDSISDALYDMIINWALG